MTREGATCNVDPKKRQLVADIVENGRLQEEWGPLVVSLPSRSERNKNLWIHTPFGFQEIYFSCAIYYLFKRWLGGGWHGEK